MMRINPTLNRPSRSPSSIGATQKPYFMKPSPQRMLGIPKSPKQGSLAELMRQYSSGGISDPNLCLILSNPPIQSQHRPVPRSLWKNQAYNQEAQRQPLGIIKQTQPAQNIKAKKSKDQPVSMVFKGKQGTIPSLGALAKAFEKSTVPKNCTPPQQIKTWGPMETPVRRHELTQNSVQPADYKITDKLARRREQTKQSILRAMLQIVDLAPDHQHEISLILTQKLNQFATSIIEEQIQGPRKGDLSPSNYGGRDNSMLAFSFEGASAIASDIRELSSQNGPDIAHNTEPSPLDLRDVPMTSSKRVNVQKLCEKKQNSSNSGQLIHLEFTPQPSAKRDCQDQDRQVQLESNSLGELSAEQIIVNCP